VASEDEIAEWYAGACEWLEAGGLRQYEISNFAQEHASSRDNDGDSDSASQNDASNRKGRDFRSRHNVKYWRREPYVGFGLDAHSMLRKGVGGVRWANSDELDRYDAQGSRFEVLGAMDAAPAVEVVGKEKAFEEAMFLGLRMNEGVEWEGLRAEFGEELMRGAMEALEDVEEAGLVVREGGRVRLTARGRMASNEVFGRLLVGAAV
jgi:oxygen-independent coproporphyrinogen-3 oxidase